MLHSIHKKIKISKRSKLVTTFDLKIMQQWNSRTMSVYPVGCCIYQISNMSVIEIYQKTHPLYSMKMIILISPWYVYIHIKCW